MNILLTAIGSMSAAAVISSLRTVPGVVLIGTDIHPGAWIPVASLVDEFVQVREAADPEFPAQLEKLCRQHKVEFVFPLTDPEVDVLSVHRERFQGLGVTPCIPNREAVAVCRNKKRLYEFFAGSRALNPIPTFSREQARQESLRPPLIAKKFDGRSSIGQRVVDSVDDVDGTISSRYVFQPLIQGAVHTVDYIRDRFGNSFSIPRQELIRTANGAGLTVETREDPGLAEMAAAIGETLNILGCINAEFIWDGSSYRLLDINPRFSAGIAFSSLCGYDFPVNHLRCFRGETIAPAVPIPRMILAKHHAEVVLAGGPAPSRR